MSIFANYYKNYAKPFTPIPQFKGYNEKRKLQHTQ